MYTQGWHASSHSRGQDLCKMIFKSDVRWLLRNLIQSAVSIHATCHNLVFLQDAVWTCVAKRATSRFNSFSYNVSKQVALFCCPFYRCLRWQTLRALFVQFISFTLPIIHFVYTPKILYNYCFFSSGYDRSTNRK